LVLVHEDLSADVYVNDFEVAATFRSKRSAKAGELIRLSDIADIQSLKFPSIQLAKRDSLVFCWKVGWKFGLYFDFRSLDSEDVLDTEALFHRLGQHHNYLSFQNVYDSVSNDAHFDEMIADGWFPFIALLPAEFESLSGIYRNKFEVKERMGKWLEQFEGKWTARISDRWWGNQLFDDKQKLIQAGLDAYNENSDSGNINCIKTLYSEVEGLLQYFFLNHKKRKLSFRGLVDAVKQQAESKTVGTVSLMFPDQFASYLDSSFFKNFDLASGKVDLSRHSSAHGIADESSYTRVSALQGVLILDQLFYYL